MKDETIEESISRYPDMIKDASHLGLEMRAEPETSKIFVSGMGGSGISADILKAYSREIRAGIPVFTVKDYHLPNFADEKSLVFIISYSGETEETLSCYSDAMKKGAKIIAITSGGKLEKICESDNSGRTDAILIPQGMKPRAAMPYLFFPMLNVLANSGILGEEIPYSEIIAAVRNSAISEKSEEIAEALYGRIPLIYTSQRFKPIGARWKSQFNENADIHAFCNVLPEMDHNEIMAFSNRDERFCPVFIGDENDFSRVNDAIRITKEMIAEKSASAELMLPSGKYLVNAFSAMYTGDLASVIIAKKYGIDPSENLMISEYKRRMQERK
ncbi:MAG: bifunctional phosphoglucose/phosphomannose isomerase [Candidatus Woesearchaeota archaeon]|nr:bifunctional phosphoglucose/phosphomannose isomerase [Candidatus Woesearchaeota archaeon]